MPGSFIGLVGTRSVVTFLAFAVTFLVLAITFLALAITFLFEFGLFVLVVAGLEIAVYLATAAPLVIIRFAVAMHVIILEEYHIVVGTDDLLHVLEVFFLLGTTLGADRGVAALALCLAFGLPGLLLLTTLGHLLVASSLTLLVEILQLALLALGEGHSLELPATADAVYPQAFGPQLLHLYGALAALVAFYAVFLICFYPVVFGCSGVLRHSSHRC